MRISPLGIWGGASSPEALADIARLDSSLTHPNPVCREACAVFVVAIARVIGGGGSPEEVHHDTLAWAHHYCVEEAVKRALRTAAVSPPDDYVKNEGWVITALQNAFHQMLRAPGLEEGVVRTVMAGGDTDTNAAVAGALLGAVHGRDAIPDQWRRMATTCRPIKSSPRVIHPRPQALWPVDALEIAEALLWAAQNKDNPSADMQ